MNVIPLFPIAVGESFYSNNDEFKELFYNNVFKYISNNGYSSERTGHVTIHHEQKFEKLFSFIQNEILEYFKCIGYNSDMFTFYFVKTWLNIIKSRDNPVHDHRDAHLSYAYYVNIPNDPKRDIVFQNVDPILNYNNFNGGVIYTSITKDTEYNLISKKFSPQEGTLFIFPSKLKHGVTSEIMSSYFEEGISSLSDLKLRRICIAGDILMTFKQQESLAYGLQPICNWKTFV